MFTANEVILIGTVSRKPFQKVFGAKQHSITKLAIAVRPLPAYQQMRRQQPNEELSFVECEAFNRNDNDNLADFIAEEVTAGSVVTANGYLKVQQWRARGGEFRNKMIVVLTSLEIIQPGVPDEDEQDGQTPEQSLMACSTQA